MENSVFAKALEEIKKEKQGSNPQPMPQASPQDAPQDEEDPMGWLEGAGRMVGAIGTGVAKAGFETSDFFLGEPEQEEKTGVRQSIESFAEENNSKSMVFSVTEDIAQFATGMVGAGKLLKPVKMLQGLGKGATVAKEVVKGAAVGAIVIDPHEERLSNLIQSFPTLENPVTEYLMASPDDSAMEGRFKNALEGIGMDLAIVGVLGASLKVIKSVRGGDQVGYEKAMKELEEAQLVSPPQNMLGQELPMDTNGWPMGTEAFSTQGTAQKVDPKAAPEAPLGDAPPAGTVDVRQVRSTKAPAGVDKPYTEPKQIVPEEAINEALTGAREDIAAIQKFGSYAEALANGYKFGSKQFPAWRDVQSTEEMQFFVDRLKASRAAQIEASGKATKRQGYLDIMKDSSVRSVLEGRAKMFNEDPAMVMGMIAKAGDRASTMVADVEVSYLVANKMLQDAFQTAVKVKNGLLDDWAGDAAAAGAELSQRMSIAFDMVDSAKNLTANAGRSLRRHRKEFAQQSNDMTGKLNTPALKNMDAERLRGMDPKQLADILVASKGDPEKLAKLGNRSWMQRAIGEVNFSLTNSLLWLWPTHVVNTTSNLYMLAARPTEKLIGAGLSGNSTLFRQSLKEYRYTVAAIGDAWENAVEAFKRGDSVINPHGEEFFAGADLVTHQTLPWKKVETFGDILHNLVLSVNYRNIVGLPTRALGTIDEFVKNLRYRAVVQAEASIQAEASGLKGADAKAYIKDYLEQSFDEAGVAVDPKALREAQTTAFQQQLLTGTLGAGLQNLRTNYPALGILMPFIKTPMNVLRYGIKYTPGLNVIQTEYRKMLSGEMGMEAQAQAIGQMSLGSLFLGSAAILANEGRMTGSGPKDPKLKQELLDKGWKPYSIVMEDENGVKTYVPMGRFDPVGLPMGMVADIVDMLKVNPEAKETDTLVGAVMVSLLNNLSDRSYLSSFSQAMRAVTEPDANLAKWLGTQTANAMPLSSLIRGVNPDPVMREARGFIDNALKNLPGYSDSLPPRRDAFGEPMERKIGLLGTDSADLVEAEHNRIILETGKGIETPSPNRNGVDLRDLTLEDGRNAYDRMQELMAKPGQGASLKDSLSRLIQSEAYKNLVDGDNIRGTKLWAISQRVQKYRELGFKRLLSESPMLRKELSRKAVETRAKYQANREAQKEAGNSVNQTLEALGIYQ